MTLKDLEIGESAYITGETCPQLRRLGFRGGTLVTALHKSFRGGLTAYSVKGGVFALRDDDAACINLYR
ncbi:hypothetical protein AGMMS49975_10760 [Clostridia bacterium]|nr:hypothetical protein AGMMS49975_10760 [Clostridia bacterium]